MRKFLVENGDIITLSELEQEYNAMDESEKEEKSFSDFLSCCMWWNNGALTEIMTDETPNKSRAVIYCSVLFPETGDTEYYYFTEQEIEKQKSYGRYVLPFYGKDETDF